MPGVGLRHASTPPRFQLLADSSGSWTMRPHLDLVSQIPPTASACFFFDRNSVLNLVTRMKFVKRLIESASFQNYQIFPNFKPSQYIRVQHTFCDFNIVYNWSDCVRKVTRGMFSHAWRTNVTYRAERSESLDSRELPDRREQTVNVLVALNTVNWSDDVEENFSRFFFLFTSLNLHVVGFVRRDRDSCRC